MRPVLQNTAIKNCWRFSSSVICWSFCVQFNHLLRDILGLGPPPSSFGLACYPITRHQKVRAALLFDACAVISPHSLQVVLMSFSPPPLTHSIITTQLPSRPGQNRGANSGTSGQTSCKGCVRAGLGCIQTETKDAFTCLASSS